MKKRKEVLSDDFIRINNEVKEKLRDLKIFPRETYSNVIERLIKKFKEVKGYDLA